MLGLVGLWSHALAALLYAGLTGWQLRRRGDAVQPLLAAALAATALWAAASAAFGPDAEASRLAESLRNMGWLGSMLVLLRRGGGGRSNRGVLLVHGALLLVLGLQIGLDLLPRQFIGSPRIVEAMVMGGIGLRMMVAVGALVLVHNLYTIAAPDARWGIRLATVALAAMWAYDLNLYTVAYLTERWSLELFAIRGLTMALLVPLFAVAMRRNVEWRMRVSRRVTFSSLTLLAIGGYLVAMVAITRVILLIGGDYARVAQVTVVFGMSVAALVMFPSGRMRAWIKVKVAKHFFRHRYDYRAEWLRFTDTLGVPHEDADALDVRVVKAIADITESPGGLLLLPDESGGFACAARWNWNTADVPAAPDRTVAAMFGHERHIVAFDALRSARDAGADAVPGWIIAMPRAWAAVPLVHLERLVGVVILERPRVDRGLDWEDFDLLRVAGRQVASYLAEARGQEALSDARRFDEFNRRFAFIMHDIKNLVSQLGLLARNAERHADNPAFRADMIATLNDSTAKMNELLARLSQHHQGRAEEPRPVALGALVDAVVAPRRALHPIRRNGRADLIAVADPQRLEQALGHLVQNAIDASEPDAPVWITIEARDRSAAITVRDQGRGMSTEFIRTRLFKPFASTKEGGFGIGAFEARSLVTGMGGRIEVESREGEGARFTILLPLANEEPERMIA
jgi:putative PEP-CTERM system histidine kinase